MNDWRLKILFESFSEKAEGGEARAKALQSRHGSLSQQIRWSSQEVCPEEGSTARHAIFKRKQEISLNWAETEVFVCKWWNKTKRNRKVVARSHLILRSRVCVRACLDFPRVFPSPRRNFPSVPLSVYGATCSREHRKIHSTKSLTLI